MLDWKMTDQVPVVENDESERWRTN